MELTETIISNKLPDSIDATYHHKHMDNNLMCAFTVISPNQTRYEIKGEYTAFRGFIPKMFEKQAQQWMKNFKEFTEK